MNYNKHREVIAMLNRAKLQFHNSYMDTPLKFGIYSLYQLGDISCQPGQVITEHRQKVKELTYVLYGSGRFVYDKKELEMAEGDLFYIGSGGLHTIASSTNRPLRYFYLGFEIDNSCALSEFFENRPLSLAKACTDIGSVFYSLFAEFISKTAESDMLVEAYLTQIFYLAMRQIRSTSKIRYNLNICGDKDRQLIYDIINYIDCNIQKLNSLSELGGLFGYSYPYISKQFSKYYGGKLSDYFAKRRFEKANTLLKSGYTVTQAAESMGFGSIHAFSRAYKKYFGITPSEYKERNNLQ